MYRDRLPILTMKKRQILLPKPSYPDPPLSTDELPDGTYLEECLNCKRSFRNEMFGKHLKICEKVFLKRLKEFESWRQRLRHDLYSWERKLKELDGLK